MKKICEYCGKEYEAKKRKQKYCSIQCQRDARTKKVIVKCDYCGKEIVKKQCYIKNNEHHFCNSQCRGKWDSKHNVGEDNSRYTRVTAKCDYCGKEFVMKKYKLDIKENHYCSRECQYADREGRKPSPETIEKLKAKALRGKDSPHWKADKTDEERINGRATPEDHIWKMAVYERDDYTCQVCGKRGGTINAHHLNGYNWDKEHRYDVDNGVTLCKKCHKRFHKIYGRGNNTTEQYLEYKEKYRPYSILSLVNMPLEDFIKFAREVS